MEASSGGSMALAGILLKLGAYGLFRLRGVVYRREGGAFILFFSLIGGAMLRVLCIRFVDFKVLIAYSSVAHMRLVIGGIISSNNSGEVSSLGISLRHGFVSSGLFFGAGLLYARTNRRLFTFNNGVMSWAP